LNYTNGSVIMMDLTGIRKYNSHGDGHFDLKDFKMVGENVVFEHGVLVFNPRTISLGSNIYIGHHTILKGYTKNEMNIKDDTWIGQMCFLHSAGGIDIGRAVGIGPCVKILTSFHKEAKISRPVLTNELEFQTTVIEDGCDIGIGSVILPGVTVGEGAIVGAGSVVTKDVEPYSIVVGNPAKLLRMRA